LISVKNLKKSYGENTILENVSLKIEKGDVIAVIGPSGCGKSTLLRCINLLEKPDSGEITVNGLEITKKNSEIDSVRMKMGMVYQNFNLFSHKTVLENVIIAPVKVLKMPREKAIVEALKFLKLVGISNRADFMPDQLSGGQKQRVAIARCLAMHPDIILFDEPTSALDPTMIDEVLSVIKKLVKSGMTSIIVTHEMTFAKNIANKVFFMEDKGIYEIGTPEEIFDNPKKEKTKIFINKLKIFEASFTNLTFDIYEIGQKLAEYCFKYDITKKGKEKINLLLEEILFFICERADTEVQISLQVSYNEATGEKEIVIIYAGQEGNILENEAFDIISLNLIKGLTSSVFFIENGEENTLKLSVR